jgi:hypothetical protein
VWTAKDEPHLALLPAQQGLTGIRDMFGTPLKLMMAAVGIVLLIACECRRFAAGLLDSSRA